MMRDREIPVPNNCSVVKPPSGLTNWCVLLGKVPNLWYNGILFKV
jgi:hypothetical protein